METGLWEVLVPTESNEGKPYRTRYHRVWDAKVKAITGGLSIFPPIKGQWQGTDGHTYLDRMIPVRIVCTREQIETIMEMSVIYYDQEAILAYKISEEVIFKYKNEKSK